MMAYIYRHIRLDKNEPFYIGIGKDDNKKFTRAYSKKGRSSFWRSIVSNYGYEVEILLDNLTWEEACEKEKEFITLYGRKDSSLGTLVNFTNGGDGVNGYTHNQNRLDKLSKNSKGSNNPRAKSCIHFDTFMKFNCLKDGCTHFNLKYSSQVSAIRKKQSTAQFYFENEYFERPTREQISKKLSALRMGEKNHRYKKKKQTK
jgi:hypothetical protein